MNNEYLLHTALAAWAFVLGAFLCAVYDVFRLFRLNRKQNAILLFFSDILFCVFSTVCLLILFFNLSYGRVRFYALAITFIGFLVWRFTVSRLVMMLINKLLGRIKKLLTSIKMRISVKLKRLSRRIYTKNYCKKAVLIPKGLLK